MSSDAKLATVRKLLALAEDPGSTESEAAACRERAERLMIQYGIDEALVHIEDRRSGVVDAYIRLQAPYVRDRATLVIHVAHAMRCESVIIGSPPALSVHVFGLETDVRGTEVLVTSLLLQAARDLAATPIPPSENPAAFRRSWWQGFSQAVYVRLREADELARTEAQQARRSDEPSVEVVLADRSQEIQDAVHASYTNLRPARRRRLTGTGIDHGYTSGKRADLGLNPTLSR